MRHENHEALIEAFVEGNLSRRQFVSRLVGTGVSATGIAAVLAACGSSSGTTAGNAKAAINGKVTGTITFLKGPHSTQEVPLQNAIIKDFERLHPGATVKFQEFDWTAIGAQVQSALASGSPPDVLYLPAELYSKYSRKNGPLEDITPYLADPSFAADKRAISPIGWNFADARPRGGSLSGVPYTCVMQTFYFINKTLMQKSGVNPGTFNTSFATLRDAAKKMTASGTWGMDLRYYTKDVAWFDWESYFYNEGATLLNSNWTGAGFDSPAGRSALQFLVQLQTQDKVTPPAGKYDWDGLRSLFAAGKLGIHHDENTYVPVVRSSNPKFDWDVAILPAGAARRNLVANSGILTIPRGSQNKAGAWALIKYWSALAQVKRFHQPSGLLSWRTDAPGTLYAGDAIMTKVQREFQPLGWGWNLHPKNTQLVTDVTNAFDPAFQGSISADAAIAKASSIVKSDLAAA